MNNRNNECHLLDISQHKENEAYHEDWKDQPLELDRHMYLFIDSFNTSMMQI